MSTASPAIKTSFWTLDRVADALDPLSPVNLPRGTEAFGRVWTDTRTIETGDLFVALIGERFDAHDFVAQAVASGAVGVVVSRPNSGRELGVPVFEVADTLAALGALGRYRRRAWGKPVVAVVGTNGKTSTKELIRAALGSVLEVHATTGNLNNLIGVPLTLLATPDYADVAVVEMGTNQPGEIPRLRAVVEPDITVVTSVAEEHLEGLGDLAGVMREELAAADRVQVAIVPASQPDVVDAARQRAGRVVAAGLDSGDVRPTRWSVDPDGRGRVAMDGVEIHLPLRGVHNIRNAMLALAVARECGVSLADAARGVESAEGPAMRTAWEQLGRVTLINDAYNASPASMRAALELLGGLPGGRQRVAVLGTMRELGSHSARLHEELAREALGSSIEVIAGAGEMGLALHRAGAGDPRLVVAEDIHDLWTALEPRLASDAVILLKASRGVELERLVPSITAWANS